MNSINTNLSALTAQQNMQKQNKELDEAMARLSSGLRINSAADDAAGSAIASKMEAQVRSLDVAIRNSYDAISMTQTAVARKALYRPMLLRTLPKLGHSIFNYNLQNQFFFFPRHSLQNTRFFVWHI